HCVVLPFLPSFLFFFPPPSPTALYTLSLHDALPIFACRPSPSSVCPRPAAEFAAFDGSARGCRRAWSRPSRGHPACMRDGLLHADRKSTRLNSSHVSISYAVFCLKKKKTN